MQESDFSSAWSSFSLRSSPNPGELWIPFSQIASSSLLSFTFYSALLMGLYFFFREKKQQRSRSSYFIFALFLLSCGTAFLFDVLSFWWELDPWRQALNILAALSSVGVVYLLVRILPVAFRVPIEELLKDKDRELGLANDKYNLLLAGSGVGIYEYNDLSQPQKPIFWSPRMFELLGFKPNSFEPNLEFFLALVHPEDRSKVRDVLYGSTDGKTALPLECRIRVLNDFRWFQTRRVVQADSQGKTHFAVGSLEDIHQQKLAEEQIKTMNATLEEEIRKRTHQLEVANHAKTRFLANMSHEMRTPLGLVLGFSEVLKENPSLNSEARDYVQMISKNGEMLSRVINDLLDLSKIEAGKLKFQYSRVQLKNLIEDIEKSFREKVAQKNILLLFQNLCPDQESVVTDEIRLKQIVYNLISNAIKFTEQGSVHVTLGRQDSNYYIDVVDTGTGIPDKEKAYIFDEFVRGEIADSGKTSGTGLGLRLAQNLAQALGGNVEMVSSHIGKGSHFRMTFQSDDQKFQHQVERQQDALVHTRLHEFEIFVLDDNAENIRLAEIFIKKLGCRVRGFTQPQSLFAELVSQQPDLILLDINMPQMNGFEVYDRLRSLGYQQPIWALTAYSLNEDVQSILEYGFDDYIRKPISIDGMKRKLTFELKERMHD